LTLILPTIILAMKQHSAGKPYEKAMKHKLRLAVVSPFLDKRHGTERRAVEWISQLAAAYEIHVYSQRVDDLDPSKFTYRHIPKMPGPHLVNFLWWFAANHIWRAWDRRVRGVHHDIVFSPGANCLDADAISVHIVFAEYLSRIRTQLSFANNPLSAWLWILHRKLYYRLAVWLERRAYTNPETVLILIAHKTGDSLACFYGRHDHFPVLYLGIDHSVFHPGRRMSLREEARIALELTSDRFAVLLVGNDWRNKGLPVLLDALTQLRDLPIVLLVAGSEDPSSSHTLIADRGLEERVRLLPPRTDVEFYYAAADAYAGPSLEDTFALPPAEAMACGLPVIVSSANGTCEIITDGADGLILADPTDAATLARMIRRLCEDREFRERLGENAAKTAQQYTWERNGRDLAAIFEEILQRKVHANERSLAQES
jgi:glycosyltransferase involved in cell wall biosynthesis